MTIAEFVALVQRRLRDDVGRQWTTEYITDAVNAAFSALCHVAPQAYTEHRDLSMIIGTEQQIDEDLHRILHILHNKCPTSGDAKQAIIKADLSIMDKAAPQWRQDAARGYILHYLLNAADESKFYVWPPVGSTQANTTAPTVVADPGPLNPPTVEQEDIDAYNAYLAEQAVYDALPTDQLIRGVFTKTPCIYTGSLTDPVVPTDPGPVTAANPVEFDPSTTGITIGPDQFAVDGLRATTASPQTTAEFTPVAQGFTSGKYVWAIRRITGYSGAGRRYSVGITSVSGDGGGGNFPDQLGDNATSYGYEGSGDVYFNSVVINSAPDPQVDGDIIYNYLDLDAGTWSVKVNSGPTIELVTGLSGSWWPAISMRELFSSTYISEAIVTADNIGAANIPAGFETFGIEEVTQEQVDDYQTELAQYNIDLAAYTAAIFGKLMLTDEMPFDKAHFLPLQEFSLYYGHVRDDEQTANTGRAMQHWQNFWQLLNKREDSEIFVKAAEDDAE